MNLGEGGRVPPNTRYPFLEQTRGQREKAQPEGFRKPSGFLCARATFLLDILSLTHFIYFNKMKNTAGNKTHQRKITGTF